MGASSSGGSVGVGVGVTQGKPCLSILITASAACVVLFHVAITSNSFVEKEHL